MLPAAARGCCHRPPTVSATVLATVPAAMPAGYLRTAAVCNAVPHALPHPVPLPVCSALRAAGRSLRCRSHRELRQTQVRQGKALLLHPVCRSTPAGRARRFPHPIHSSVCPEYCRCPRVLK
jgi:hypothetical protein